MTQQSSLLASLGAALRGMQSSSSLKQRQPALEAFELRIASRLEELQTAEDCAYLGLPWLQQAASMALATNSEVAGLVTHLQTGQVEEKWIDDYLDDSAKLLDCCTLLRQGLGEMEHLQRLVQLALHALEAQESLTLNQVQCFRARSALADCQQEAHAFTHGQWQAKLDSSCSMLRTMADRLAGLKSHQAVQEHAFFIASYGAKVTTIFVCSLMLAAISCKNRKPLLQISVSHFPLWSSALLALQHKVREDVEMRKGTSSVVLLRELDSLLAAVNKAYQFLDSVPTPATFPLGQEQVNDLGKVVEILRASAAEFEEGAVALDNKMNDLFRSLVATRVTVLDCIRSLLH